MDDKIFLAEEHVALLRQREPLCRESLEVALLNLAEVALERGALHLALDAYIEIGDKQKVQEMAELCLAKKWVFDAEKAFKFLEDKTGLLRAIRAENPVAQFQHTSLDSYVGETTLNKLYRGFHKWTAELGYSDVVCFSMPSLANVAYTLRDEHDIGMGIARGGLNQTYVFELMGLHILVCDAHRTKEDVDLSWHHSSDPSEIYGKRIVVFDKDVRSGRTTGRVLHEIQKYNPKIVDLVVIHDPCKPTERIGTILENVPHGFRNIYYPSMFDYSQFDKAIELLEKNLRNK